MVEVNEVEWLKQKFPILIGIGFFVLIIMILGTMIPDSASCCGKFCPTLSNDILVKSMNERLDIIHNILWSLPYRVLSIFSIALLTFTTLNPLKSAKRFLKVTFFDWNVILVVVLLFAKGIIYMNTLAGVFFGGCI